MYWSVTTAGLLTWRLYCSDGQIRVGEVRERYSQERTREDTTKNTSNKAPRRDGMGLVNHKGFLPETLFLPSCSLEGAESVAGVSSESPLGPSDGVSFCT